MGEQPPSEYTHDQNPKDLEVSEGVELDKIAAHYTKAVELAEGSAKESYDEVAETQDLKEAKRGMELFYGRFQGQIIMNKELVKKLEAEIKKKYQILKEQKS